MYIYIYIDIYIYIIIDLHQSGISYVQVRLPVPPEHLLKARFPLIVGQRSVSDQRFRIARDPHELTHGDGWIRSVTIFPNILGLQMSKIIHKCQASNRILSIFEHGHPRIGWGN